ncbi:MAG: hypothetical protein SFU99_24305 [Saprospiraceae bacterium]|nr:hypothetical protein [Saprospiraceae bacterium]
MENNYEILQNAIKRLPQYAPNISVWDAIEHQLDIDQSQEQLQSAIHDLPSYAPPAALWERIEENLDKKPALRISRGVWLSAAAAILLAVVSLVVWLNQTPEPTEMVQMQYAQAETHPIKADWDEEDAVIQNIADAYAQRSDFLKNTGNENLLLDLKELNQAKAEIKTMMQKYGQDAQLVRSIAEIERERSEVVKKMAQEI